jgi:hypothetical protein
MLKCVVLPFASPIILHGKVVQLFFPFGPRIVFPWATKPLLVLFLKKIIANIIFNNTYAVMTNFHSTVLYPLSEIPKIKML